MAPLLCISVDIKESELIGFQCADRPDMRLTCLHQLRGVAVKPLVPQIIKSRELLRAYYFID